MASDYTDHELINTISIINACLKAGQPERIVRALLDHRSAAGVKAELAVAAANLTPQPAAVTTTAPAAASRSIFGEPTPEQRDALAAALQHRFQQMYPKPAQ